MTTSEKIIFYLGVALILGSALARIFHYLPLEQTSVYLLLGTLLQFNGLIRYNRRLRKRIEELEARPGH